MSYSDPDGNPVTVRVDVDNSAIVTAAQNDLTTILINGVGAGTANITITLDDGQGGTATTSFTVTVNDVPVIVIPTNIPTEIPTDTLVPTEVPPTPTATDIPTETISTEVATQIPIETGTEVLVTPTLTATVGDMGAATSTMPPTADVVVTATPVENIPTSSIIVRMVAGLSVEQQLQVINRDGGAETSSVPVLNLHFIDVPSASLMDMLQRYRSDSQVLSVELDHEREVQSITHTPDFSLYSKMRQVFRPAALIPMSIESTSAIAILDTGIDATHPYLSASVLPGFSAFEGANPLIDPNGHGTAMAGIVQLIANNSTGLGFATIRMMPVQVLDADGTGQDSDIINGIIWATDNGASVILMAFSNPGYSAALQMAIDYAWSKGVVLVAATGNDSSTSVTYPAGDAGVMGVSATDGAGGFAPMSNYGSDVFIAAPGINITTTGLGGTRTEVSGTSASAAYVAGTAAFMRALNPTFDNGVIVGKLARNADAVGTQAQTGNGQVNLARALSDTSMGSVKPASAAYMGTGGPFVGPYVIATVSTATLSVLDPTCTTAQSTFYTGYSACASTYITTSGSGNNLRMQWYNPSGTLVQDTALSGVSNGATVTNLLALTSTNGVNGTWTVKTCATSTSGACSAANTKSTQTFTVVVAAPPTITIGAVTPNTSYTPLPGFVMASTGKSFTISVNITNVGNGDDSVHTVTLTTNPSAGKAPLYFQASGSSGTGGSVTWGTPTVTNNTSNTSIIVFPYTGTLTTGQVTLTVALAAITQHSADQTDSFTLSLQRGTGGTTGDIASANTLKRYSLLITTITPPSTSAAVGQTVSPVISVTNYGTGGVTLTAANTSISGSAFKTTGTEGSFASIASGGSGTVSYTNAVITGTAGSQTVEADAGKGTTNTSPHFSKTITVNPGTITLTITGDSPNVTKVGDAYALTWSYSVVSPAGGTPTGNLTVSDGTDSCTASLSALTCNLTSTTGGTKSLTATYVNDGNFSGSTTTSFTHKVNPANTTITWSAPSAITYGTALSSTQLNATASVPGTLVYTPALGTVLNAGSNQKLHVDFTPTDTASYNTSSLDVTISVNKAALTITADSKTNEYGTALPALTASYSGFVNGDTVSVLDTAVSLTTTATSASAIGSYPITASGAADVNYTISFVAGTMAVGKRSVVISIDSGNPNPSLVGQNYVVTWTLSVVETGTGTASGTVTVSDGTTNCSASLASGSCSFASSSSGTKTLVATYSGDTNFSSATSSGVAHSVNKVAPVITWSTPADVAYGTALSSTQLNATANVPGTFVYTPAVGAVLNVGNAQTLHVDFTPTDTVKYLTASKDITVNVVPAAPTITWSAPSTITYGTALSSTQLNATASVPGTLVYTPTVGAVLNAGSSQTLHVVFTPTDTVNYTSTSKDVTINVNKAALTITADSKTNEYGTALPALTASYSGFVNGDTVSVLDTAVSLTTTATSASAIGSYPITASGAADVNYTISFVAGTMAVGKRSVVISIDSGNPNPSLVGQNYVVTWTLSVVETGTGTASGTVTVSDGTMNCSASLASGSCSFASSSSGTKTLVAIYSGDTNFSSVTSSGVSHTVNKVAPVITWSTPADVAYGTALSSTQLNASANVPGTFVYTPAVGAVLNVGNAQTLHVDFTPTDTVKYLTASKDITVNVAKAATTITISSPQSTSTTVGQAYAFSWTVAAVAPAPSTPTGTVTISDGTNSCSASVASGTCNLSTITAGTTALVATYSGDSNFLSSISQSFTYTVGKATPVITWNNPGDVIFGTALSSAELNATASVLGTFVYTPAVGTILDVGDAQTLHVDFTPTDFTNYVSVAKEVSINVLNANFAISINSVRPGTAVVGQPYTITWHVSTSSGTPTGTVTVNDAKDSCSAAIEIGSCTLTSTTMGTKLLIAYYSGDDNFPAAQSPIVAYVVDKATPTLDWGNPADIIYGTALSSTQLNALASTSGSLGYTPTFNTVLNAGLDQTLHVVFTPFDTINYNSVSNDVVINVQPASTLLEITSNLSNPTYLGEAYTVKWTLSESAVGGDAPTGIVTISDGTDSCSAEVKVGQCNLSSTSAGDKTLIAAYLGDENFHAAISEAKLHTVYKLTPIINWENPVAITYGTPLSATQLNSTTAVAGTFVYTPSLDTILNAGENQTLNVEFTPTDTDSYASVSDHVLITVHKAPLAITVDNQSKAYGAALPELTANYSGFVNGDSVASLDTSALITTKATDASNIGEYPITVSGAADANYVISFAAGILTVDPLAVTVTAIDETKVYGSDDLGFTYTYAPELVGKDSFTGKLARATGEDVGQYAITRGTLRLNVNYSLSFVGAQLTINPLAVTITASDHSKTYGDADAVFAYTYTPELVSGDAFSGTLSRAEGEAVGAYEITQGTLALSQNYNLSFVGANLTINPLAVTVTANADSKTYGAADSAFTYTYAPELVSGDAFSGALSRAEGEVVGAYEITQGTLALSQNYNLSFVGAKLNIAPLAITITADAQDKTYGDADSAFTYTYTPELVSGDAFSGALSRAEGEDVGAYEITQDTLALNSNYLLTFVSANLTINPLAVTVTANAASKTYGSVDPLFAYTYTPELVSGDAFSGTLSRAEGEDVGAYEITQGTLALSANYALNFVSANLTINPLMVTVTANERSKTYGSIDPVYTYTYTPALASGDNFSGALSRTTGENAGSYTITKGSLALSANYQLTFVSANLTINPLAITATADSRAKNYGEADPAFTYTYTPALVAGDSFSGTLSRVAGENMGTYAINKGTLALSSNYTLNYVSANLIISTRVITVTAAAQSKTYGSVDPVYTYTYTPALASGDSFNGALSRATGENVGTYTINKGTLTLSGNYTLSFVSANLTINPRLVTVTAAAQSKTYGAAEPTYTYTYTPALASGDSFSGALSRAVGENIGTYAINKGTLSLSSNYTLTFISANLTISTRVITITAAAQSKNYGSVEPIYTYTYSPQLVTGDAFSGALSRAVGENIGTYAINNGTLSLSSNYTLTFVSANLTIASRTITVTATAQSKIYGSVEPTYTYTYSPQLVTGDAFSGALSRAAGENIGTYAISKGTLALNGNYALTFVSANLTINPRTVTVTAVSQVKAYGDADPVLTYTYSPELLRGDTFNGSLGREVGEDIGAYAINQGTLSLSSNYALTFVSADLRIDLRTITVTAASQVKAYGDADPALTYTYSPELLSGDSFSGSLGRDVGEDIGAYTINKGTLSLSSKYTLNFVSSNLTISKAVLTVTADDKSRPYGDPDPVFTVSYSGFKNGEILATSGVTGLPALTTTATPLSLSVNNPYPIVVSQGTLSSNKYNFKFVNGRLVISKVVVTANNQARAYGIANPSLNVSYSGFKTGQTLATSGVTGSPSCTTTATALSPAGDYPITCTTGTLTSVNYSFTFVGGTFTVTKAPLTATPSSASRVYGNADPSFSVIYAGFKNNETLATSGVTGTPVCSSSATTASAIGSYPINCTVGTLTSPNYSFTFASGSMTINKALLTVTADAKSRAYGDANPAFTVTYTGFKNGQTLATSGVTGTTVCTSSSLTTSGVGSYPITCTAGTLAASNYSFTFVSSNLTILKAPLTVTADSKSRAYGSANPTFTVTYTGFKNGQTFATSGIKGVPVLTTTVTTASPGGNYPINVAIGTMVSPNYSFTLTNGTLTVTKAPLMVVAVYKTRVYGDANPDFAVTYSGFKNGQTLATSGVTGAPTCTTTAVASSAVGSYPISCATGTLTSANYNLTFTNASLTIAKAPLTATADSKSRVYGDANPALTVTYTGFKNGQTLATSGVSGAPVCKVATTLTSAVGSYPITCTVGTLVSSNYSLAFANGTLTVTKAALTITAANQTRLEGAANPAFTVTYAGFKNGQTLATSGVTGVATCSTTATVTSPKGSYPITCTNGTLASVNYRFVFVDGALLVQ